MALFSNFLIFKMEKNVIAKVCVCSSLYNLLLYLLVANKVDISKTYFFFNHSIPDEISKHFKNSYKEVLYRNRLQEFIYYSKIKFLKYIRWPFLKQADIYGADHIKLAFSLVGKRKMTVIEDGVMTYKNTPTLRTGIFYKIAFGPLAQTKYFGQHNQAKKIVLTGILPYENTFHIPVQYININELWAHSDMKKQCYIKSVFNLTEKDLSILKNRTEIVFTQPLSEDQIITEEEKINLYRTLLTNVDFQNIIFRPHPRETTNYAKYFPNCYIYNKKIPFELLFLSGVNFNKAYTIFSTIVYCLPKETSVVFGGTQMHPNLIKKFGVVEYKHRN